MKTREQILKRIIYHQNKIIDYLNYTNEIDDPVIDEEDMQISIAILEELKEILKMEVK